jgi:hypothetical protein
LFDLPIARINQVAHSLLMKTTTKPATNKTNNGYACKYCKAFNTHGPVCGCQKSREEAGRTLVFVGTIEEW